MKYLKVFAAVVLTGMLCLTVKFDSCAIQYDFALVEKLPEGAALEDYIILKGDDMTYEVKKGDTLWGISEAFLGDGAEYMKLYHANEDIIADADVIFPGQILSFSQTYYIPKDKYDRGGLVSEGGFRIAEPDIVDNSYFLGTQIDAYSSSSDITIYSLPVKNEMGKNALTNDWEAFTAEVVRCSEEICEGRVSNLQFEKYRMEDGIDLCGYTFDFDAGSVVYEFAVFYRLGEQNMAEVIGVRLKCEDTAQIDVTRYIAASFVDYGGKIGMGWTKMTDNVGAYEWDYPELHNLFVTAMNECLEGDYAKRPEKNTADDEEIVWKEPRLEKAVRNALAAMWHLDYEEEKAFLERPLTENDLSTITSITCVVGKSAIGSEQDDTPVVYLKCNDHSEQFHIGKKGMFSCEDLAHFKEAKELSISSVAEYPIDYSFVGEMTQLRSLDISTNMPVENIDFLAGLKKLRTLYLTGYGDSGEGEPIAFTGITDLSVLENCTELRYLGLDMPLVTDFSFLEKCPNVCTFILLGTPGENPALPDEELLPNARFIEAYDESIRWEP